jgi:hypothetical protein
VGIPAIVTAGDRGAAKAIYGRSKVYLEVASRPLVARVVVTLQSVPEVDEVWVVGDRDRLEAIFSAPRIQSELTKPLHITEQHTNLYENAWETYKRALPGAPPEGREPEGDDLDQTVLYVSADLPFATPQELSHFINEGVLLGCDYALGLVTQSSLESYLRTNENPEGLDIAFFNLRDGRLRQSNLHLAKPARILNRHYIQDMYRHRHMREFHNMVGLGSKLLVREGGLALLFFYMLMHLGGLVDRLGLKPLAWLISRGVSLARNEWGISKLMNCRFRFVVSEVGGCAIDVDTEDEYDRIERNFDLWTRLEAERSEALLGPVPEQVAARTGGE